jgi:hypothetical protein
LNKEEGFSERAAQTVQRQRLAREQRASVREDVAVSHETGASDDAAGGRRDANVNEAFYGVSLDRFTSTAIALFCGGLYL